MDLRVSNAYLRFKGADFTHVEGENPSPTKLHFLLGNEPAKWMTDVPTFGSVRVRALYPGVDLVLTSHPGRGLDWYVQGTGAAREILPEIDTTAEVSRIGASLSLRTDFGHVSLGAPRWLAMGAEETFPPLVPVGSDSQNTQALIWGTYLGSWNDENAICLEVDAQGCAVIGGWTASPDIPVPNGFDATYHGGGYDMYLAKIAASGSQLLWATYLGGMGYESIHDLALDSGGGIVIGGFSTSDDIPVPGGYQVFRTGGKDAYVAKLSASGSQIFWGTFLGGSLEDMCDLVSLDNSGTIYVSGITASSDIPTPGGYDTTYNGGAYDFYLARLAPSGSHLDWGTFLGGAGDDRPFGLGVDAQGDPVTAGYTESSDIPTTQGAYCTAYHGNGDLYAAKLSASGSRVIWGTYIGGSGDDGAYGLALDADGNLALAGFTSSTDIPTPGGYQQTNGGGYDYLIAGLSSDGSHLRWATYLGTGLLEWAKGISLDSDGNLLVSGRAVGPGMPGGGYDGSFNGGTGDIYLCELSPNADSLFWGSYLGGSASDVCYRAAVADGEGNIIVAGSSTSLDIPTPGGFDSTYGGDYSFGDYGDIYVAKLSLPPAPPCSLTCTARCDPASGAFPLETSFLGDASPQYCGGPVSFSWDFGDGGASVERNPLHTYTALGMYTWTMVASADGASCSESGTVTVVPPCVLACEASATPDHGAATLSVAFAATVEASDCPGSPAFLWSFGDGETSAEQNPTHAYAEPGTYTWTCTVTAGGKSCSASGSVTVIPGLPGDGNGDGVVSIGEVQQAINMFLETQPPGNGADCNGDGSVSIGEVQKVINSFLGLPSSC